MLEICVRKVSNDVQLWIFERCIVNKSACRGGAPQASNTNLGTETAFRQDHCKAREHIQESNHLWGQRSVDTIKLGCIFNHIDLHAQRHRFRPKTNHFRGQSSTLALNLDILDAGQSPNAVRNYTGGFPSCPPATCRFSTGDLLITTVKETIFCIKKSFEIWKKVKLVRISHWSESDENAKTSARHRDSQLQVWSA